LLVKLLRNVMSNKRDKIRNSNTLSINRLENKVTPIRLIDLSVNPDQPRKKFDEKALNELKESIIEHGLLEPILVKQLTNGKYQIIAGERRYRATKLIPEKETIQCIIKFNVDSPIITIIENLQREDLTLHELGLGYQKLKKLGLSGDDISRKISKPRSHVFEAIQMSKYPKTLNMSRNEARAYIKELSNKKQSPPRRTKTQSVNFNYKNFAKQILKTKYKFKCNNSKQTITISIENKETFAGLKNELIK